MSQPSRRLARSRAALLLLPLAVVLFSALQARAAEMTVSAAASLTNAFTELKTLFEKAHPGLTVHVNFAASNPLLKQIVEGAPVDVFASADQETMNQAGKANVIDQATRRDFARNDLVLIVPRGAPRPADLAALTHCPRIAVGNPDSVPAGRYTRAALEAAGLWNTLRDHFIQGVNVRQVLDYVARGEVDAGFVYRTDAQQMHDKVDIVMPVEGHAPILYPIAVATTGNNAAAGKEFLDFVLSPEGRAVLARYGFSE